MKQTFRIEYPFFIPYPVFLLEFTTMAGRRLRDAVKEVLTGDGNGEFDNNVHIVIAGLTNTYSQYVTTFEEYQIQRYEVCELLILIIAKFS